LKNKEFVDIDELLPDKEAVGKEEKEKQSDVKYLTSDKKKDKKGKKEKKCMRWVCHIVCLDQFTTAYTPIFYPDIHDMLDQVSFISSSCDLTSIYTKDSR
jgi:hypothetical protein